MIFQKRSNKDSWDIYIYTYKTLSAGHMKLSQASLAKDSRSADTCFVYLFINLSNHVRPEKVGGNRQVSVSFVQIVYFIIFVQVHIIKVDKDKSEWDFSSMVIAITSFAFKHGKHATLMSTHCNDGKLIHIRPFFFKIYIYVFIYLFISFI